MVSRTRSDPKVYREMSVPFDSSQAANDALEAFFVDLGELRKKHRMANVYVIVTGWMNGEDGEEQEWQASCHYGDGMRAEAMTAWAFGREQGQREASIGAAIRAAARAK